MTQPSHPDCPSCRHHFVTWEAQHPNGCRAYGFKTRGLPSVVVLRESGQPCARYEPRPKPGRRRAPTGDGH